MATMRCPNCSSEIHRPGNPLAIIIGTIAVIGLAGFLFIIISLAAIAAIGSSASAEYEQVSATLGEESISDDSAAWRVDAEPTRVLE